MRERIAHCQVSASAKTNVCWNYRNVEEMRECWSRLVDYYRKHPSVSDARLLLTAEEHEQAVNSWTNNDSSLFPPSVNATSCVKRALRGIPKRTVVKPVSDFLECLLGKDGATEETEKRASIEFRTFRRDPHTNSMYMFASTRPLMSILNLKRYKNPNLIGFLLRYYYL